MGLDKETVGLIVGGLILVAILFVAGIYRQRDTCLRCGNSSSLILRYHDKPDHDFQIPESGMNSLNANTADTSGDALPC